METQIEGIVERCSPNLCGHGDHGYIAILVNDNRIFHFPGVREAYADALGRPSSSNDFLVSLMSPGDKISFMLSSRSTNFIGIALEKTLRNWTLEQRFLNNEKDTTNFRLARDH